MTIKLIKTDSEFLEVAATKIHTNGQEWYYLPFWYKRVGEDTFEQVRFENLPKFIIDYINSEREKTTP